MNIEFKPQTPGAEIVEDIYLAGGKIGYVRTSAEESRYRCHAVIDIDGGIECILIQGRGDSKESAILAAIEKGRRNLRRALLSIDDLEQRLLT